MLWIGRVGVFLPLLVIVRCHLGDTTFGGVGGNYVVRTFLTQSSSCVLRFSSWYFSSYPGYTQFESWPENKYFD